MLFYILSPFFKHTLAHGKTQHTAVWTVPCVSGKHVGLHNVLGGQLAAMLLTVDARAELSYPPSCVLVSAF